jgi:hypothetical protein
MLMTGAVCLSSHVTLWSWCQAAPCPAWARQPQLHTPLRAQLPETFIESVEAQFDVCVDTSNPDIRLLIAA